jgi:hypothetical protein
MDVRHRSDDILLIRPLPVIASAAVLEYGSLQTIDVVDIHLCVLLFLFFGEFLLILAHSLGGRRRMLIMDRRWR